MAEKYSSFWIEVFPEKYYEQAAAASLNHFRNHRIVRLSDIDINKRNFNYWKNNSLFSDMAFNAQKGWAAYNGVDEMALLVVGELWKFGFGIDYIKPVLNFFYQQSLIKNDLEIFLKKNSKIDIEKIFNPEQPDLFNFFLQEKNNVSYFLNNIEFIMLLISRVNKNISLVIDANGNLNLLIGQESLCIIGKKSDEDFLLGTSLHISISKLHINIYQQSIDKSNDALLSAFKNTMLKPDKEYKNETLDIDININSAIKEFPNQDIKIEVRNKHKVKIVRTIITSK